jgi:hypothetical protein
MGANIEGIVPINNDVPVNIRSIPRYIGFLECLYIPARNDKETVKMIIQRTEIWKCMVMLLSVLLIMHIVSGPVFAQELESGRSTKPSDTLNATMPGERNWAINIYGGVLTDGDLNSTLAVSADMVDSYYFVALALTRTIKELNQHKTVNR